MALLKKPLYLLSIPILLSLTLPLAFFAALTTISAFTVLLFRLIVIYIEIGLALLSHYIPQKSRRLSEQTFITPTYTPDGSQSSPTTNFSHSTFSSASSSPVLCFIEQPAAVNNERVPLHRRKRKISLPIGTPTAIIDTYNKPTTPFPLPISTAPPGQRDFEGVGGWRLDSEAEDTRLFTSINSRLELPGTIGIVNQNPTSTHQPRTRNHRRRATSGSLPMGGAYNPVVSGRIRHSSTSTSSNFKNGSSNNAGSFNDSGGGGISYGNMNYNDHRRTESKSAEIPSPNISRIRTPASSDLSVTPLASPVLKKSQRRPLGTRSVSEDYLSRVRVRDGVGDGKKRLAGMGALDGGFEEGGVNRLSVSSVSSRGSEEVLDMKLKKA